MLNLTAFVNNNKANVSYATALDALVGASDDSFAEAHEAFEAQVVYDTVNDDADPVYVYLHNSVAVAWYDWENMCGYIAQNETV